MSGFVFSHISSGDVIDLPQEYEDLLIAIILELVKDEMILSAPIVYENMLDAETLE